MAEYIELEAALKVAEHAYHEWNLAMAAADGKREINLVYKRQELCKAVEAVFDIVPAADVAPVVHARWGDGKCSNCGVDIPTDDAHDAIFENECRFCYYCGARMDGGDGDAKSV